jgi:transcriptional regulator with XRE-family HTH domain
MAKETFATRLTALRKAAGMSQYRLAKESGVSKQTLSGLELGLNEPSWATVQRIAAALGTDCRAFADAGIQQEIETAKKPAAKPRKDKGK